LIVLANGDDHSYLVGLCVVLLDTTVWSFARVPYGLPDRNSTKNFEFSCFYSACIQGVTFLSEKSGPQVEVFYYKSSFNKPSQRRKAS